MAGVKPWLSIRLLSVQTPEGVTMAQMTLTSLWDTQMEFLAPDPPSPLVVAVVHLGGNEQMGVLCIFK